MDLNGFKKYTLAELEHQVEENPELFLAAFAGADADLDGFLTYIVNGFVYDASGIEV